jgi:exopolysaccharide biosynthesis polyprenyl glycosylphosphotransferase
VTAAEPVLSAQPAGRTPVLADGREGTARAALPEPAPQRPGQRLSRIAVIAALPLADSLGLTMSAWGNRRAGPLLLLYASAVLAGLAAGGQHRLRICARVSDQAGRILAAAALPAVALLPGLPAAAALRLALWSAGLLIAARVGTYAALRAARRRGRLTEPALVIGSGTFGAGLAELMSAHPELGLRPVGFLDDGPPRRDLPFPVLGRPAELGQVIARLGIRRVIIAWSLCRDEDLVAVLRASRPLRADVCVVPRLYELGTAVPRSCLDEIWGVPLIPLRRAGQLPAGRLAKRAFDLAAASLLLVPAVPVMLLAGLLIRLESGLAPLFRQTRVTGAGRLAQVLKLRTLAGHGDPDTCWTAPPQECTRVGRFLRATHLDELPQLVNVLRGDMSLVGPRPERPYFAERFSREVLRYADRTRMPAGVTGWAQVHGLNGDTSLYERARFDNQYIENWSIWLDLTILARTIAAALPSKRTCP